MMLIVGKPQQHALHTSRADLRLVHRGPAFGFGCYQARYWCFAQGGERPRGLRHTCKLDGTRLGRSLAWSGLRDG